ncbi:hypothetical protein N406_08705 [Helicobacter pylori FD577]|nr:hypothetical protein N406_08705 [Helicobacter pylori FD577]
MRFILMMCFIFDMFYLFILMMHFIFIYSKLYLFKALFIQSFIYSKLYLFKALFFNPPFPSFPMIFIHFFQTLKFLPNPKNFKQTLSIACL